MKTAIRRIMAVTAYSIAMGYLESAVVIYLREITFGNSFQVFPVQFLDPQMAGIEIVREAATIIMPLAIGYLAGKTWPHRFLFFVYSFAIWDLFYYLFLKITTGWPGSLGDFDVLFLIPVMWIGPVLCPMLIALLLAITSVSLVLICEQLGENHDEVKELKGKTTIVLLFLAGSGIELYSFTEQIFRILMSKGPKGLEDFTPTSFDWPLFAAGYILLCIAAIKTVTDCYHKMTSKLATEQERKVMQ